MQTKMNEYQEAIKRVELDFEDRIEEDNILMVGRVDIDALQGLVDRATPMKPTNQYLIDFGLGNCGKCKRCKNGVNYQQKYCGDCGQALDWSKDE